MSRPIHAFFGGTFNPVHFGHLRMALELQQQFQLNSVSLVPAGVSPLKQNLTVNANHRLAMLQLAVQGSPHLRVDDREFHRSGPSFTVDTLHEIRSELGSDASVAWVMGMDSFLELHRWHRWEALLSVAHLVILARPDATLSAHHNMHEYWAAHHRPSEALALQPCGAIVSCALSQLAISSTAIRETVGAGLSPQFWVPEPVWAYIKKQGLYGAV